MLSRLKRNKNDGHKINIKKIFKFILKTYFTWEKKFENEIFEWQRINLSEGGLVEGWWGTQSFECSNIEQLGFISSFLIDVIDKTSIKWSEYKKIILLFFY